MSAHAGWKLDSIFGRIEVQLGELVNDENRARLIWIDFVHSPAEYSCFFLQVMDINLISIPRCNDPLPDD